MPKNTRKIQQKNTQGKWLTIRTAYINREDEPSMNELAGEFSISQSQLGRKAKEEKWVLLRRVYWDKMGIRILEKVGKRQAEIRARNIAVAEGTLAYLTNLITDKKLKGTVGDVDKITRLIEFLYGGADSRPDYVSGIEKLIKEIGQSRAKEYKTIINEDKQITAGG